MSVPVCHLSSSNNNVFARLIKEDGSIGFQITAGQVDYKGPRKKTVYAAQMVGKEFSTQLNALRIQEISVIISGSVYSKRVKSVLRAIMLAGVKIQQIEFKLHRPHNGVRPRKAKRK